MNEVKLLNIGGIDQNVKDQYARDIIAPSENGLDSTSNLPVASRHYDAGEFLIGQDRLYYEALVEINVGDTLVVNSNIKATTVSDELVSLRSKSADAAIECIAPMEKTGLSSAEYKVGEYLYWDYGTNAGLYKAKIGINIGDAFVVDTNIEVAPNVESQIQTLTNQVNNVVNKVSKSSDAYSPSKPYKVGDLVIHDDVLYRCITRCSAASWSVNQSCFTEDTLANVVNSLNTQLIVTQKVFSVTNSGNETKASMLNRLYSTINAFVNTITMGNLHTMYLNEWYGTNNSVAMRLDVATIDSYYRFSRMDIGSSFCNRVHDTIALDSSEAGYYDKNGTYHSALSNTTCAKIEVIIETYK